MRLHPTGDANGTLARPDREPITVADVIDTLRQLPEDTVLSGGATKGDYHWAKLITWRKMRLATVKERAYVHGAQNMTLDEDDPSPRFAISFW